ncbi:MAG TPA: hypothetical protein VGO21_01945 [Candidatus Paceibacterota bacterium]|nr:hypothetical protein [Candidatus Paceibacterota bacterium]
MAKVIDLDVMWDNLPAEAKLMSTNNDDWNELSPEEKIEYIMDSGYAGHEVIECPYVIENGKIYIAWTDAGHDSYCPHLTVRKVEDFITDYEKEHPDIIEEFGM